MIKLYSAALFLMLSSINTYASDAGSKCINILKEAIKINNSECIDALTSAIKLTESRDSHALVTLISSSHEFADALKKSASPEIVHGLAHQAEATVRCMEMLYETSFPKETK